MTVIDDRRFQKRFETALNRAFTDYRALERMVYYGLDEKLADHVAPGAMEDVIFALITKFALPQGRMRDLVQAARSERPNVAEFDDLAKEAGLPPKAAEGLQAVANLANKDKFRRALSGYRAGFEVARLKLNEVAVLKKVHDWLHDLQNLCYAPMLTMEKRFPSAQAVQALSVHLQWLQRRIDDLDKLRQPAKNTGFTLEWADNLPAVIASTETAIAKSTLHDLCAANAILEDILSLQLTEIDAALRAAAKALQLEELARQLQAVHDAVAADGVAAEDLAQLQSSVASLRRLHVDLTTLVTEHQRWQGIDNRRRLVGQDIRRGRDVAGPSWNLLLTAVLKSAQGTELLAQQLVDAVQELDQAVATTDADRKEHLFARVDGLIAEQFLAADRRLKELTGQLQDTASAMNLVLVNLQ